MSIVKPCSDAVGFDCNTKLNRASAKALAAMGFKFAIRYTSLHQPAPGDIDVEEKNIILGEIGALWLVQHPRNPGWSPSLQLGQADATASVRCADSAEYLGGATLWQDLEGVAASSSAQAVIDYTGAYGDVLISEGFLHGLYDGFQTLLTSAQMYHANATVKSYWADFGNRDVDIRGVCMKQLNNSFTVPALGFAIDVDMCFADRLGGRPMWLAAT